MAPASVWWSPRQPETRVSLAELSVRRPIAILMVTLAVSTFGYLAVGRLPVDLLPDLSYPTLTVQTVYEDAAPVSVEQFVTEPVEEAIGVIPGVRSMRSHRSRESMYPVNPRIPMIRCRCCCCCRRERRPEGCCFELLEAELKIERPI